MKRAKMLVAMMTIASLVLGTFSVAYADLSVSSKSFTGENGTVLGEYPVVSGMDDLNKTIKENLDKIYKNEVRNDTSETDTANLFKVSYEVANDGSFSTVTVNYALHNSVLHLGTGEAKNIYYVNVDDKKVLTEDDYKAGIEAQTAAAEEATEEEATEEATEEEATDETAEPAEILMVSVRAAIEPLGYDLAWDGKTKSVTITKDDFSTIITVDKNAYTVDGEEVELDAAPSFVDGTVIVPTSFLEKVLGLVVVVEDDGTVVISFPEEATAEEATEEAAAEETTEAAAE